MRIIYDSLSQTTSCHKWGDRMPTRTFFRLPEEKRQRLIEAAWDEFSRVSYTDASINQIIHAAHIPRGSFYQYFEDKGELFWFLRDEMRCYFFNLLQTLLEEAKGDLFQVPVRAFDRFFGREGVTEPRFGRYIQVMRLNQGMDFHQFLPQGPGPLPDGVLDRVNLDGFRDRRREFLDDVFCMTVAPLAYAVMETLREPEQRERQRSMLMRRIEIVKWGSLEAERVSPQVRKEETL